MHECLPQRVFKEFRRSIKENGLQSSFTVAMLAGIAGSYLTTPWDWMALAETVLMLPAQFAMWKFKCRVGDLEPPQQEGLAWVLSPAQNQPLRSLMILV